MKPQGDGSLLPGSNNAVEDVGRVPAGADSHSQVALLHQGPHLAGEDLVEGSIVTDRGEDRGVSGQGDGWQGVPVHLDWVDHFSGYVLGIRSTTVVAEENDLSPRLEGVDQKPGNVSNNGNVSFH